MILLDDKLEAIDEAALQPLLDLLPEWRRQQALRFRHLAGRRECTVSYLLLCQLLREHHGIDEAPRFVIGEHGKPTLADYPHLHFNISHCRCAALCAVDERPVGVDVERVRPVRDDLLHYTMNADEIRVIKDCAQQDVAFTQLWTRKEAVCKLLGTGIGNNLRDILLQAADRGVLLETTLAADGRYAYTVAKEGVPRLM